MICTPSNKQLGNHHSLTLILFKRVARNALWVSVISMLFLGLLIMSLNAPTGNYFAILQSLTNSQDNLPYLILAAAALLIGATATTTYFIIIYSSFRVAGPLYRFARNLEFGHQNNNATPFIKIRQQDYFHQECDLMSDSTDVLLSHYQALSQEVEQLAKLNQNVDKNKASIISKIKQLKLLEARMTR